jgi:hypothetical protein
MMAEPAQWTVLFRTLAGTEVLPRTRIELRALPGPTGPADVAIWTAFEDVGLEAGLPTETRLRHLAVLKSARSCRCPGGDARPCRGEGGYARPTYMMGMASGVVTRRLTGALLGCPRKDPPGSRSVIAAPAGRT